MTNQEIIALAAVIRDEAKKLEDRHANQDGFTTHTMRCQTLYLKLCEQTYSEALPSTGVASAALKVTEALGETDVTKIRVPGVLALALLNLERVVRRASGEAIKGTLKDVERHPVGPDDARTYFTDQALHVLNALCITPDRASPEALAGLRELVYEAKKTEAAFADTLAKKCDELAAENRKLRAERDAAEIERDKLNTGSKQ